MLDHFQIWTFKAVGKSKLKVDFQENNLVYGLYVPFKEEYIKV